MGKRGEGGWGQGTSEGKAREERCVTEYFAFVRMVSQHQSLVSKGENWIKG